MKIFFDVDTQVDFMLKKGSLYVPGAEGIIPNLKKLTEYARKNKIRIFGSVDRHFESDPELKRNGGLFPDHCMDGTKGQEKIDATKPLNPFFVENRKYSRKELDKILRDFSEIFIEKQSFDVFSNPNTDYLLKDVKEAFVYGVATEFCVDATVKGMVERKIKVFVVEDAIKAVDEKKGKEKVEEWKKLGVNLIKTDEVVLC